MQLPSTTPEQRAEIYKDVRKLLHPGFLAHPIEINGVRVVLRSLSENDWSLLQYRVNNKSSVNWKRWSVASSIWMVDGQIILGDEGALQCVYHMCTVLPLNILEDLYAVFNALMRRVRAATECTESFLYENESRYLWKSEGARVVEDGRLGFQDMGLNPIQKLWLFFNRMEDESNQEHHDWAMAKFIAGPHVPKGIKKINAKDKQTRNDLTRKRQEVMDYTYYVVQGTIPKRGEKTGKRDRFGNWQVRMAETAEELQDEMRRWVSGIKDDHDNVVDGVKTRIKTEVEGRRAQAKAQRDALERAVEEEGLTKSQLIPMTGQAAQDFIDRVKARIPGSSKVIHDSSHNSAYEKYIKNNPDVGVLRVDSHGNITSTTPVDPNQMIEMLRKPTPGEGSHLQDLIQNRQPTLDSLQPDWDEEG